MRQHKKKDLWKLYKYMNQGETHYKIVTGHAGFVKLYKNGNRIQPKNFNLEFRV